MAERARIVMLSCELGPISCGGLGTMVTALCRSIDRARFQPVVVVPRSGRTPPWPHVERRQLPYCLADRYEALGAEIWLLSNPVLDSDGVIYPEPFDHAGIKKTDEYGERVAELLADLRPGLLHLHDAYAYKCLYEARRLGVPTVLTVHRLHEDEPPLAFAELASVRLVDVVTTVSHAYHQERADFFASRRDVEVIPNGIDLGFWSTDHLAASPEDSPQASRQVSPEDSPQVSTEARADRRCRLLHQLGLDDRPTFAFVGRLDRDQKGVDVLLDAYERHLRGAPLNLLVAGVGDRDLAARIARVAAANRDHVRFVHRMLSQDEVRAWFGAVDVALIPSRYEPFGLILLEAMAMGALPIAARVGGLREVLEPTHLGRCVDAGDAPALARAISDVASWLAGPAHTVAQARHAARACAEAYSSRRMAERYEALYGTILNAQLRPAA